MNRVIKITNEKLIESFFLFSLCLLQMQFFPFPKEFFRKIVFLFDGHKQALDSGGKKILNHFETTIGKIKN